MGKGKCPDCPTIPGWVTTFGDLMSLLLTFFILLLSFSSVQESEFNKAKGSIMGALGLLAENNGRTYFADVTSPPSSSQSEGSVSEEEEDEFENEAVLADIQSELDKALSDNKSKFKNNSSVKDLLSLEVSKKGIHILITDSVMFASGKSKLKDTFKILLTAIGKVIAKNKDKYDVIVEGHTDNTPISTAKYPSNWELSAYRAIAIVKFMTNKFAISQRKFSAIGYGEFRPVANNNTKIGRRKNRRVEIYLVKKDTQK